MTRQKTPRPPCGSPHGADVASDASVQGAVVFGEQAVAFGEQAVAFGEQAVVDYSPGASAGGQHAGGTTSDIQLSVIA